MKRIAFVLAVVVALTACLFALSACGDQEESSSAAESKAESAAESAAESKAESKEESKAESAEASGEEPAASSEEPAESTEPAESSEESGEEPVPGDENLALNKPYTHSDLYPSGETPNYPDEGDKSLTDGVSAPAGEGYADPVWAGFNVNCADYQADGYSSITVDLGESKSLAKYVITCGSEKIGSGIKGLQGFEVFVSEDGTNFTSVGATEVNDSLDVGYVTGTLTAAGTGRYVQFRFTGRGNWMFVSEVEVY